MTFLILKKATLLLLPIVFVLALVSGCTAEYVASEFKRSAKTIGLSPRGDTSTTGNWVLPAGSLVGYGVFPSVNLDDPKREKIEDHLSLVLDQRLSSSLSSSVQVNEQSTASAMSAAYQIGVNFLLTAQVYRRPEFKMLEDSAAPHTQESSASDKVLMYFLGVDEGVMHGDFESDTPDEIASSALVLAVRFRLFDVATGRLLEAVDVQPKRALWYLPEGKQLEVAVESYLNKKLI